MQSQEAAEYQGFVETKEPNSQDDIVREQFDQHIRPYLIITGVLCAFLFLEIYRWYTQSPPLPGVVLALFLISLAYVIYQMREYRDHISFLKLGKQGEPEIYDIAQIYAATSGATLYKEITLGAEDVDYVIVDQSGVLLVNVYDWKTPQNNEATIEYNDEDVLLNGYRPDVNPMESLRHIEKSLQTKLSSSIGQEINVKSLVVFPGWFVMTPKVTTNTKIINPREALKLLESRKGFLTDNDKTLLNYHFSKLIKQGES